MLGRRGESKIKRLHKALKSVTLVQEEVRTRKSFGEVCLYRRYNTNEDVLSKLEVHQRHLHLVCCKYF